jgi:hypothetical protein
MRQLAKFCLVGLFFLLFYFVGVGGRPVGAFSGGPDPGNTGLRASSTARPAIRGGGDGPTSLNIRGTAGVVHRGSGVHPDCDADASEPPSFWFQATVLEASGKQRWHACADRRKSNAAPKLERDGNNRDYIEHTTAGHDH